MIGLEILDTAIKIGLGALITGIIAFLNQKTNIKATIAKDKLEYNRKTLTQISSDIEEINHLVLKIWAIFEFETKQTHIDKSKNLERLDPLRNNLFNDFHLLSKNEGLLLLHGYTQQQEKLRIYGELLGKFNSYTLFRNDSINVETTANFKAEILEARKNLYLSLNSVLT
ncbi:hypothetical protein [Acinetobacter sp. WCHAc010052]|uniref:hypothetical protein n=1 Tax=Acinetobacter sp. WCHAc010052 TaxID=2004647 RepID=UPI000B3C716D|nr:hypothetical protein [Acinetobacter sp. WCHAc010052]AXY58801.1 hypothetical protein CDG61_01340 [Acinetobacter sp. WCHAc010052]